MCEPHHSFIQVPDEDDRGPTEPRVDANEEQLASQPEKKGFWSWAKKKIGSWFHISRLGFGHTETLARMGVLSRLPEETRYETRWWDRTTEIDGRFNSYWRPSVYQGQPAPNYRELAREALDAATNYGRRVSVGNLTLLRQFLETSLRKSERPLVYLDRFITNFLNQEGGNRLVRKLKALAGVDYIGAINLGGILTSREPNHLELVIKVMMAFTRHRNLLCPEWADDQTLWVPS